MKIYYALVKNVIMSVYTVSVTGVIGENAFRNKETIQLDLSNFLPDPVGTNMRDLAVIKCASFIAHETTPAGRTGSIRLLNVAAPYSRSTSKASGVLAGHLFCDASNVWRLSNPFRLTAQQIPNQLEVRVVGLSDGTSFGVSFEIEV